MKKELLFIDYLVPTPDKDAGSLLAYNTLLILSKSGFKITLLTYSDFSSQKSVNDIQKLGVFYLRPKYVDDYLSRFGHKIDVIYGTRYNAYGYYLNILKTKCIKAKFIFHTVDLAFLRETREFQLKKSSLTKKERILRLEQINLLRKHELECMRKSDISILTSKFEKNLLEKKYKIKRLSLLGLVMKEKKSIIKYNKRKNIFFLGNYNHTPNIDAVDYFTSKILPKLIKKGFSEKFLIAGTFQEKKMKSFEKINPKYIKYIGFQKNLDKIFSKTRLFVSPLRFGAGIKGKLATCIAYSMPVIASKISIEGMRLGKNVVTYNNDADFIKKILKYYNSEKIWNLYQTKIHSLMKIHFGVNLFSKNLEKCFHKAGIKIKVKRNTKLYF